MAKFGLIGKKLGHSFSKIIHEKMGYEYDLVELKEEEVKDFVLSKKYLGFNVTIPYKKTVMPYLDYIDEGAKAIGSVNTIIQKDGKLCGYNTDIFGMEYAFAQAGIEVKGKKVIILGSGGTYETANYLAKTHGAREIVRISRSGEDNYDNISKHYDANIVINTTPVGMFPNNEDKLIDLHNFKNLEGFFDAIYNPLNTNMLLDAKEILGDKGYSNGLKMLVAQAKAARDLFFGTKKNDNIIDKIVEEIKMSKTNIVIIGMPGSGKSTVGRALATKINRPFIDTDETIIEREGMHTSKIILDKGEPYFRDIETKVVKEVAKLQGYIIATGGGVVLREENMKALKQNGFVIFLDRNINNLSFEGRPLSQGEDAIKKMYKERIDLYTKYADAVADSNVPVEEVADNIISELYEKI